MQENRKQRRARQALERRLRMTAGEIIFLPPPEQQTTYQGHKRHKGGHFGDKFKG